MLCTKRKIINNFNKQAAVYSASAEVQDYVAEQLAAKLEHINPQTILEIGCGTGLLSRRLVKLFPTASMLLTDVAPAMLTECQKNLPIHPSLNFACMDGEHLDLAQYYELIVSSMTLHWFTDLQKSFLAITDQLQQDGEFIFSLLGENSFKEWQAICRQFDIPIATPHFPAVHLLQTMLPNVAIEVETYTKTYADVYAFLNSLKQLGATASRAGYIPLPAGKLRRLLRQSNNKFTISYEVIYGRYTRS